MAESSVRVTLTKAELDTAAGQELCALLRELSTDGMVSRDECERLRQWLESHAGVDLQCRPFLSDLIGAISADGEITEDELDTMALGIERVLPASLRVLATVRRKELRVARRTALQAAKAQERADKMAARQLARPLDRADFIVAGAMRSAQRREACEGLTVGESIVFDREPDNVHDANAIIVLSSDDSELGYVPRDDALRLAPLLDRGAQYHANVKKLLDSRSGHALPVVVATFYRAGAQMPTQASPATKPEVRPVSTPAAETASKPEVRTVAIPTPETASPKPGGGCLLAASVQILVSAAMLTLLAAVF